MLIFRFKAQPSQERMRNFANFPRVLASFQKFKDGKHGPGFEKELKASRYRFTRFGEYHCVKLWTEPWFKDLIKFSFSLSPRPEAY